MINIVNFSIIPRVDVVLIIKGLFDLFQKNLLELIINFFMNIEMISCYTGLSTVDKFPKDDPQSCTLKISSLVNDDRTFSS